VTARDRIVIVAVLVAAALGGFWFVGLAPKRKEAATLQTQIDAAHQRLVAAQQKAADGEAAKKRYDRDYADIAKLGKAVPKSDALPSLLYQLQGASHSARIDFRSLKVSAGGGVGPTPTAPAATTAKATTGDGSTGGASSGSTSSSSSSSSTPSASAPAPATQAAAATLPPGAIVGSAGFPTMPFSFLFTGSFFDMENFLHDVHRFVRVDGKSVDVRGRLLSVDAFSLSASAGGFPNVQANITATAYLLSPDEGTATPTTPSATPNAASATSGASPATPASTGAAASEVTR
jgi:hypothetical protein